MRFVRKVWQKRVEIRIRRGRPRNKREDIVERLDQQRGKTIDHKKRIYRDRENE